MTFIRMKIGQNRGIEDVPHTAAQDLIRRGHAVAVDFSHADAQEVAPPVAVVSAETLNGLTVQAATAPQKGIRGLQQKLSKRLEKK